jgi:hypothetical protein
MLFRTELHIPTSIYNIKHDQLVLLLGSCFSQHIGERLQKYKFKSISNPFGTIFHPNAIARLIDYIVRNHQITKDELFLSQGVYVHPYFHSNMANISDVVVVDMINNLISALHHQLKDVKYIFLTLGTSIGYKLKSVDQTVANCHKLPSDLFYKDDTSIINMVEIMSATIDQLTTINEDIIIILTVSPVRHIKDGILENARSKAKLLMVSEELCSKYHKVNYFPAYEWMMDDLRDYRFYDKDLIHPNEMAIDYIWDKFSSHYFDQNTMELVKKIGKISTGLAHRPFNPESAAHQNFVDNLNDEIKTLEKNYEWLKF